MKSNCKHLIITIVSLFVPLISFAIQGWEVKNYSEATARAYLANSTDLDPIEGIWQTDNGFLFAIEKCVENGQRVNDRFRVVVLENESPFGWKLGHIKGFITPGAHESIYSFQHYLKNQYGTVTDVNRIFLALENQFVAKYEYFDGRDWCHVAMYKLFPRQTDNSGQDNARPNGSKWTGTGFFLSSKGYIVTNQHVIDGAKSIKITSINGDINTSYTASVEVSDAQNDLAILKITDVFTAPTIPYTFKFSLAPIGGQCWVLGYPLIQTMGNEIKLTNGLISSTSGFNGNIVQYQISVPVQPGNSGGPVFDVNGNIIGIVQAKHNQAENVSYAIKATYLRNLIDMLPSPVQLPRTNLLTGKSFTKQIELASKCVVLIICE